MNKLAIKTCLIILVLFSCSDISVHAAPTKITIGHQHWRKQVLPDKRLRPELSRLELLRQDNQTFQDRECRGRRDVTANRLQENEKL